MPEQSTFWPPTDQSTGFGRIGFGDPVPFNARYEEGENVIVDYNGREMTSTAVIYGDRELRPGGFYALGLHAVNDPRQVLVAREIMKTSIVKNLNGTQYLCKGWLR
jgi:hypothetical protein